MPSERKLSQQGTTVTKHSHLIVECRYTEGIRQQIMQIQPASSVHAISGELELVSKGAVVTSLTISYTVNPAVLQWFKNCHKILITSKGQLVHKQKGI